VKNRWNSDRFSWAGAALGKRMIPHYVIQVFPPCAVLAGAGFGRLFRFSSLPGRKAWLAPAFAAATVLLSLGSAAWSYRNCFPPVTVALDSLRENRDVADYIRSRSSSITIRSGRLAARR